MKQRLLLFIWIVTLLVGMMVGVSAEEAEAVIDEQSAAVSELSAAGEAPVSTMAATMANTVTLNQSNITSHLTLADNTLYKLSGTIDLRKNKTGLDKATIAVPENVTAVIDLNGCGIIGSGAGDAAEENGEYFVIQSNGNLTIIDSDPTAAKGFYLNNEGVALWGNGTGTEPKVTVYGGVIYNSGAQKGILVNKGTVTMEGGTITGCKGSHGPAVTVSSSGTFVMIGGKICYNYANVIGGVVYGETTNNNAGGSLLTFNNTTISHNRAVNGGAIDGYRVSLTDCTITDNTADGHGGGLYVRGTDCWVTISGTTKILRNTATTASGGGLCLSGANASLQISDSVQITDNTAGTSGGGIAISGNGNSVQITGSVQITNNTAGASGSAISMSHEGASLKIIGTSAYSCRLTDNTNTESGGAIFLSGSSAWTDDQRQTVTIRNTEISRNSGHHGAGLHVSHGGKAVVVENCLFDANHASAVTDTKDGSAAGAIFVREGTVDITDSIFRNNTAISNGGAVYTYKDDLNITDCVFENNSCALRGGAVFGYIAPNVTITRCDFTGNRCTDTVNNNGTGGAIEVTNVSTTKIIGCTFTGNSATGRGGAILFNAHESLRYDTALISGCTFTGNTADTGGAVYVAQRKDLTIETSDFTKNIAASAGGALALRETCEMKSGTMSQNEAPIGAAVYCTQYAYTLSGNQLAVGAFTLSGGAIADNTAQSNGGAVYINSGSFTMTGGAVTGNTARSNGGGVCLYSGTVTITGGEISGNIARTADGTGATTIQNGAGIYVNNGTLTMTGGTISENEAGKDGGAIYIKSGSVDIESGTVSGNTAVRCGGAAYVEGGTLNIGLQDCSGSGNTAHEPGQTHPVITANKAPTGGGICNAGDTAAVNIYCGSVSANQANNSGLGMNIYTVKGSVNYYGGTLGSGGDPGVVVTGGSFQNDEGSNVAVVYQPNFAEAVGHQVEVTVAVGNVINLPDVTIFWRRMSEPVTFVGWAKRTIVRAPEELLAQGSPQTITAATDFYAIWANATNKISYQFVLNEIDAPAALNQALGNPTSYTYPDPTGNLYLKNPSIPGYAFKGWVLSVETVIPTNWDPDAAYQQLNGRFYAADEASDYVNIAYENKFGDIILTAVFEEIFVSVQYHIVAPSGTTAGSLSQSAETLGQVHGVVSGSAATAATDFRFLGWYTDSGCTQRADESLITVSGKTHTLTPVRGGDGLWHDAVYYAKFDYAYADLEISVDGIDKNTDQSYLFTVVGVPYEADEGAVNMTVAILCDANNSGSILIRHLPVGEYTITEQDGWSWRYTISGSGIKTAVLLGPDGAAVSYTESQFGTVTVKWINTYSS